MNTSAVLLSGGMDSFALTYELKPDVALTVDYGQQSADAEVNAANILTRTLNIPHRVVRVDLSELGSGDLSGTPAIDVAPVPEWWPYRNQALITIAAMRLIGEGVRTLNIATVDSDSAHADGGLDFVYAINKLMRLQEGAMQVRAPAAGKTTAELVWQSGIPLSLLSWSHSCHTRNLACSRCRGCAKSRSVWEELERDAAERSGTQIP